MNSRKINLDIDQVEIPFATTLLVRDTCLCLHVQRAARVLARQFDEALKPAGLTNGQFSLLMSLNRPSLPGVPPATMGSVAHLLGMDRTTLTAVVKTLARRGLLKVTLSPEDKRIRLLVLTAKGRQTLAAAVPIWTATHAGIESHLDSPIRLRSELSTLAGQPPNHSPCTTSPNANPS
jgi:DNA-binding MarR family transcriptional regulator